MKVMIIGANGQVGQEVVLAFREAGHELVACTSQGLDITQETEVKSFFLKPHAVDFIINCAAYTAVDKAESESERAFAVNVLGVKYLAKGAAAHGIPLIHLSTDYVFDGNKIGAYSEDDPVNPESVYGISKWQGEEYLRSIWDQHIIMRVSWVFGRFGHNFVKTMLRLFRERTSLGIVRDQFGCPTAAADIAQALLSICMHIKAGNKAWGTYHFCGMLPTTWYDFALRIHELAQVYVQDECMLQPINTDAYPTPAKRPRNSVLSMEKITKTFALKPYAWELGLQAIVAELLRN